MHSRYCEQCRPDHRKQVDRDRNQARTASGTRKVYDQRWRDHNADKISEQHRRYRQAHPETDNAAIHRRHQRIKVDMDATDRLLSRLYRRAIRTDPCFYCGAGVTKHVDHFYPLAKGGTDHWWNLVRSCQRCNQRKGTSCGTAFLLRRLVLAA